jgi:arylsulfatase A-like enzyme
MNNDWTVDGPGTTPLNTTTRSQLAKVRDRLVGAAGQRSQFIWVHLYDPHAPYLDHPQFNFGTSLVDRYDEDIAYVDAELGRFLDELEGRGVLERTAIVLTADHGEILDGRRYGHGPLLMAGNCWVPLLIRNPGTPPGRYEQPVDLMDLYPTIIELAGGVLEKGYAHGESLLADGSGRGISTDEMAHAEVFHHMRKQFAIWSGGFKLVVNFRRSYRELYDLRNDRDEMVNLVDERPEVADRLEAQLRKWRAARY